MNLMLPKIDFAFKLIFGDQRSKNILADFLKAALPSLADEDFQELTIADPHLKREFEDDKQEILDVKVRTKSGKSIDIETQICSLPEMRFRISYYQANMITEQIGMGGYYSDLKQAISIIITDYGFIPKSKRYHTVFRMLEVEEHFPFNELMEIHVLNLRRVPADEDNKLVNWLRFIGAGSEEEIKMVAERDEVIKEAYCKLQVMSEDEANRMIYEARLKARRDEYSRIQGALREGREKGWEEGSKEGRREEKLEIARKFKNLGIPVGPIVQATGLSPEEISAL
jgi:predicted transposase/invertase (TIGR01784 family)